MSLSKTDGGISIRLNGDRCYVHGDGLNAMWVTRRPFIQINPPSLISMIRRRSARHIAYIDGQKFGTGEAKVINIGDHSRLHYSFKLGHNSLLAFKQTDTKEKVTFVIQHAGSDYISGVFSFYKEEDFIRYRVDEKGMETIVLLIAGFIVENIIWGEIASLFNFEIKTVETM